jgi:hypothetical protein
MPREFLKDNNGKRLVKAIVWKLHTWHPECFAKSNGEGKETAKMKFVTTSHSCCYNCRRPLYKEC